MILRTFKCICFIWSALLISLNPRILDSTYTSFQGFILEKSYPGFSMDNSDGGITFFKIYSTFNAILIVCHTLNIIFSLKTILVIEALYVQQIKPFSFDCSNERKKQLWNVFTSANFFNFLFAIYRLGLYSYFYKNKN